MPDHAPPTRVRTVVLGGGIVAQPTFEALTQAGWTVGLCTPRDQSGTNLRHVARSAGVPVFEADRTTAGGALAAWLRERQPHVLLACGFPYRASPEVLDIPRLGAFNVHGGKLPEYRGPQPVFWAIANQETEGAVTVHRMDDQFDSGPVVAAVAVPIAAEDTTGLHTVRLAFAAVKAVETLFRGLLQYGADLPGVAQDEGRAQFHRRPTPADLVIRWDEQAGGQIRALVKAGNPWNKGAFTSIRGLELRLTDVTLLTSGDANVAPGTILTATQADGLIVNCRDGTALAVDVVSMDEGILPGRALAALGIAAGERFVTPWRGAQ